MEINNKISDVLIRIGTNVKKYRLEKKLTQQELGYLAGNIERCTISNIERLTLNGITLTTLIKLSIVLEIEITDLLR